MQILDYNQCTHLEAKARMYIYKIADKSTNFSSNFLKK